MIIVIVIDGVFVVLFFINVFVCFGFFFRFFVDRYELGFNNNGKMYKFSFFGKIMGCGVCEVFRFG